VITVVVADWQEAQLFNPYYPNSVTEANVAAFRQAFAGGQDLGNEHTVSRDVMHLFTPVLGLTYAAAYLGIASGAFDLQGTATITHTTIAGNLATNSP
jgi:hypothetical protein